MSSEYIKKIKTYSGEKQIDYNALANLPTIPQGTKDLFNDAGFLDSIPLPTEVTLGGIKARQRGLDETAEVKLGLDGKLYVNNLSKELETQKNRIDSIVALDAELQDIRIGGNGIAYSSAGEAVREQTKNIPDKAIITGNYIRFYKTSVDSDVFLFEIDIATLVENGLNLEDLELSTEQTANCLILNMYDGKIKKSVELPVVTDSELSLTSTNPVQNRVITEQLNYVKKEKVNNPTTGAVGQILEIETVDENGKPKTYKAVDKPQGSSGEDGVGIKSVEQTTTSSEDGGSNIITVTLTDGNTSTFTVKNGSKGSQGEQGIQGEKGADGTSVTVSSVSESTADGGSNVVTFSDGNKVTIKNGTKGSKGDKGDKGDDGSDYILSDVDKEEIAGMVTVTEQNISDELRKREAIPMVTFVDDDGHKDVLTKLKPLSQTYGIPFVCAVPSSHVDASKTAYMNLSDLQTLESMGWEISSHTMSHCKLGELTDLEQEEEIGGSKEAFDDMGLNVQTICYPYSSVNASTYKIARKYFKCGRQTNYKELINLTPLETWDMRVTPLGSYFETNTTSGLSTSTLAYYKHMVDRAVSENAWLIFMTHCNEHDSTQQGYLEQVIQYVQSLNIPVVTLSEGLKKRGNIVDSGRYDRRNLYSSEYFVVGCDSKVRQSDDDKYVVKLDTDSVVASTPITAFPPYAISYCRITGTAHGFPKANNWGGGTLITNTMGFNPDYYPEYRAWQDFVLPNGNGTYRRYVQSATAWGEWIDTTPNQYTGITDAEKQEIIDEVIAIVGTGGTTPEPINLVTTSTDTDGSIFNGTGYQDGKRFSSSGVLKDQEGATATGFMPCTYTEKLKLTGVKFGGTWTGAHSSDPDYDNGAGGYCYVVLYDSNKTMLTQMSYDNYLSNAYGIKITHGADVSETTFDFSGYTGEKAKVTYVRLNGIGSGANMVVNKI